MLNSLIIYFNQYAPIFILSILSGWSGLVSRRQLDFYAMLKVATGNGILGVITLIFLNEFMTETSIETKYALIVLISFLGREEALDLYQKIKQLKGL